MSQPHRVGELVIQEDMPFMERMWTVQRVGWGLMALFVLAAVLGLFSGTGPLSETVVRAGEALEVNYSRFERFKSPTSVQVTLGADAVDDSTAQFWIDRSYAKAMPIQKVIPMPKKVSTQGQQLVYTINVSDRIERPQVILELSAQEVGWVAGRIGVAGGQSVTFTQFVYP